MPNKWVVVRVFVYILLLHVFFNFSYSAVTVDLTNDANYNLRIDGAVAADNLGIRNIAWADINNNGKNDLFIASITDYAASNGGSLYIILDSLLASFSSKTVDLSNESNFSLRLDSNVANGYFPLVTSVGDVNGDQLPDLFLTSGSTGYNYSLVLYNDNLNSLLSGSDKTITVTDASIYNVRISGPGGSLTNVYITDIDSNGKNDFIYGSTNSYIRSNGGVAGVVMDTVLEGISGLGQTLDLTDTDSLSIRYYGAESNIYFSHSTSLFAHDLNGDGTKELFLSSGRETYNGRATAGVLYVISGTLFNQQKQSGTYGYDLATSSSYSYKYGGATASEYFMFCRYEPMDLDNDGNKDIFLCGNYSDYSFSDAGALYYINSEKALAQLLSGTKEFDMATSSNYSMRFDGSQADGRLTYGVNTFDVADINGNGVPDLLISEERTHYPVADAGSAYVIYDSIFSTYSNTYNLSQSANYSVRYDGLNSNSQLGYGAHVAKDANYDSRVDNIISVHYADNNSRANSGSYYIIYNFPHTVQVDDIGTTPVSTTSLNVTGTVTATNSVTNIRSVSYGRNSNSPTGTWYSCTPDDGSFDETTEDYTCAVTGLAEGTNTIYVKASDTKDSYTLQSAYGSDTVVVDLSAPTGPINVDYGNTYTRDTEVNITLSAVDSIGEIAYMMISNYIDFTESSWETYAPSKTWNILDGEGEKTVYIKYKDTADNISLTYNDSIIYDPSAPKDPEVVIRPKNEEPKTSDNSLKRTNDRNIKIYLGAKSGNTPVVSYTISTNKNFKNSKWKNYKHSIDYRLSDGDGDKNLYIKFKDAAGNISDTFHSKIELDTQPPDFKLNEIGGVRYESRYDHYFFYDGNITFTGVTDTKSKVNIIVNGEKLSETNTFSDNGYSWKALVNLDSGTHDVEVYSEDNAENESGGVAFKVTIDSTGELFPDSLKTVSDLQIPKTEDTKPDARLEASVATPSREFPIAEPLEDRPTSMLSRFLSFLKLY